MKQYLDYAVRNWGFEAAETIELFRMVERGESTATIKQYIDLVNGMIENDWFGFGE